MTVEFHCREGVYTITKAKAVPRLFELVTLYTDEGLVHGRVKDVEWRYGFKDKPDVRVTLGMCTLPTHN